MTDDDTVTPSEQPVHQPFTEGQRVILTTEEGYFPGVWLGASHYGFWYRSDLTGAVGFFTWSNRMSIREMTKIEADKLALRFAEADITGKCPCGCGNEFHSNGGVV